MNPVSQWLLNRNLAAFAQQVRAGDWAGAILLYEKKIAPAQAGVPKRVRAVHALLRWHIERDPQAVKELSALIAGEDRKAAIVQATEFVRAATAAETLAAEVGRPARSAPRDIGKATGPFHILKRLAQAVLTARDAAQDETVAKAVLQMLPESDEVPPALFPVYARLRAWAAITSRNFGRVLYEEAVWQALPIEEQRYAMTACAYGHGCRAVHEGRIDDGFHDLDAIEQFDHPTLLGTAIIDWGLSALSAGSPAAAADWFDRQSRDITEPAFMVHTLKLGAAIARWLEGDATGAREAFHALATREANSTNATAQAAHLGTLAMIASAVAGQTKTSVEGRALWNDLRQRTAVTLAQMNHGSPDILCRRDLIQGLMDWAGRESSPGPAQLARFSAAISAVTHDHPSEKLRAIEGELITKSHAIDETLALVARRDVPRLREMHETILADLGDAIPPLTRVLVLMTIWQTNPSVDPLPELVALAARGDADGLIGQAIAQVQTAQTLSRLRDLCLAPPDDSPLPPLAPLAAFDPGVSARASLAAALISLRRGGDGQMVRSLLNAAAADPDQTLVAVISMLNAWQSGDPQTFQNLVQANAGSPHPVIRHALAHQEGIAAACTMQALKAGDDSRIADALRHIGWLGGDGLLMCTSFVLWLVKSGQHALAAQWLRATARESSQARQKFACSVLTIIVTAAQHQHSAVINAVEQLARATPPAEPAFGSASADAQMLTWCAVFRLQALLAVTAGVQDDLRARWPSTRRLLLDETQRLRSQPLAKPYADLIAGLLNHLSAEAAVDDATLQDLAAANQALNLGPGARFVGEVLSRLDSRQRVVADFWASLRTHRHKDAAEIYDNEARSIFGGKQPKVLVLADILARCVAGHPPEQLANELQQQSAGLPEPLAATAAKLASHINDARQIRQLIDLLQARRWADIIRLAETLRWSGFDQGMPLPIAMLVLLAKFQAGQSDDARELAERLLSGNFPEWLHDDAALLLGYTCFRREQYQDAAKALDRARSTTILGHDVERYGAASNFNAGVVLMKAGQKAAAFDAFSLAMAKHQGDSDNTQLAPLFLHFGLSAIETRQGDRARKAFSLLREGLEGVDDEADSQRYLLLARMGEHLCDALMSEDVEDIGGDVFLRLGDEAGDVEEHLGADFARAYKRTAITLGTCQELRREVRRAPERRQKTKTLRKFIDARTRELESLPLDLEKGTIDPVLLVLQGSVKLCFESGTKALESIAVLEKAMRTGLQSRRLNALLDKHKAEIKQSRENAAQLLDLMDIWLSSGAVPDWVKESAAARDDIVEVYRLNRQHSPGEVVVPGGDMLVASIETRISTLAEFAAKGGGADGAKLKKLTNQATTKAAQIADLEQQVLELEREIYAGLAQRLRSETIT